LEKECSVNRRFVDLSIYLENEVLSDPPSLAPKIEYQKHGDTLAEFIAMIPGTRAEDYPDGEAAAAEWVRLTTHSGTHLDAPYHFHSTMDRKLKGEPQRSITIDEVPLEWCFQPGVKLDFRHFPDGYVATAHDVEQELVRIGHALKPLEIVVVNTRAGARYGHPDFVSTGCGMGYEATMYLLERGVRLTGTDAWSWDAPFAYTAKKIAETGDVSLIWEGHKAGRDIGYCHLEKLHNLEALPADGFYISCFPHKIRAASAGWTRAVAIFDDALQAAAG
jgi:kynurenine formamidase